MNALALMLADFNLTKLRSPIPISQLFSGVLFPAVTAMLVMVLAWLAGWRRGRAVGGGALALGLAYIVGRMAVIEGHPTFQGDASDAAFFTLAGAAAVLGVLGLLWQLYVPEMGRFFEKLITSLIGGAVAGAAVWWVLKYLALYQNDVQLNWQSMRFQWAVYSAVETAVVSFLLAVLAERGRGALVPVSLFLSALCTALAFAVVSQSMMQLALLLTGGLAGAVLMTICARWSNGGRSLVTTTIAMLTLFMVVVYVFNGRTPEMRLHLPFALGAPLLAWVTVIPPFRTKEKIGFAVAMALVLSALGFVMYWAGPELWQMMKDG